MGFMNQVRLSCAIRILLILSAFAFQGCAAFAIAPLATTVMVGATAGQAFLAYKTFQLSTGGSAEVKFKDVKVPESDREALKGIKRLAILPGNGTNIKITEQLMQKTSCTVVTPAQVLKVLHAGKTVPFDAASDQLTETEGIERLKDWAAKLNADAILVYNEESGAGGTNLNFWSFKRGEMKDRIVVKVFSAKAGRFILDQPGELVMKIGSSQPPQEEVQGLVATSVVDKLMDYLKPKSTKSV